MDCHNFRRQHLAYLDDTLPGDLLVVAERHVRECAQCAAHDTAVRRALLLARNVPAVEPSPDFMARLEARLREVDAGERDVPMDWTPSWRELAQARLGRVGMGGGLSLPSRRTVTVAASLLAMASVGATMVERSTPEPVLLPPVIATRPAEVDSEPAPRFERLPTSDLVGSATAGVPVWPAALLAGEAHMQLMGMSGSGVELVNLTR